MSELRYNPEYWKVVEPFVGKKPPIRKNVLEVREGTENALKMAMSLVPPSPDVKTNAFQVKSYDGAEITVTRFATEKALSSAEPTAAVVYAHGGGLVSCSVEMCAPSLARKASQSDLPFFAVEYRLAPEHPAPAGLEDCYAAVKYVSEHSKELNIDMTKIAVMGESAGACLAASTALLARDRGFNPPLAKQLLVYPMLDDQTPAAGAALEELLVWKSYQNVMAWNAYFGRVEGGELDEDLALKVVPARAKSLRNLPPTYLEVGTLDLFRDESLGYVSRLMEEDNEVEFHLWPGLPHAFDFVPSSWQKRATESRMSALKSIGV